jgi:type IV pilus assembly protein PilC
LVDIVEQIAAHKPIYEALETAPHLFSNTETALVQTADKQGKEVVALEMIAAKKRQTALVHAKVQGATWYPKVLAATGLVAIAGYTIFLVPQLRQFFAEIHMDLVFPLNLMAWIYDAFSHPIVGILLGASILIVTGALIAAYRMSPQLRFRLDYGALNIPALGPIERHQRTINALFAIDLMVRSGEQRNALNAAYVSAHGAVYREALRRARDRYNNKEVKTLAEALRPEMDLFDPLITGMLYTAEKFGRLNTDIPDAIDVVTARIDDAIASLPKKLEAVIGWLMAIFLGFIVYAIIVPTQYGIAHYH